MTEWDTALEAVSVDALQEAIARVVSKLAGERFSCAIYRIEYGSCIERTMIALALSHELN